MAQDTFRKLVAAVRIYRTRVQNPSIKGMVQFLKDTGEISHDNSEIVPGNVHAENVWRAAAV